MGNPHSDRSATSVIQADTGAPGASTRLARPMTAPPTLATRCSCARPRRIDVSAECGPSAPSRRSAGPAQDDGCRHGFGGGRGRRAWPPWIHSAAIRRSLWRVGGDIAALGAWRPQPPPVDHLAARPAAGGHRGVGRAEQQVEGLGSVQGQVGCGTAVGQVEAAAVDPVARREARLRPWALTPECVLPSLAVKLKAARFNLGL